MSATKYLSNRKLLVQFKNCLIDRYLLPRKIIDSIYVRYISFNFQQ